MRKNHSTIQGFSLMEIVVSLAILGVIAAVTAPMAIKKIDVARVSRAKADTQAIAQGILEFRKDVKEFPARLNSTTPNNYRRLLSAGTAPVSPSETNWISTTSDSLYDHLIENLQGYTNWSNSLNVGWRGPYLTKNPSDPWGAAYVALVIGLWDPQGTTCNSGICIPWVISGGPDLVIDTFTDEFQLSPTSVSSSVPSGDIGIIMK